MEGFLSFIRVVAFRAGAESVAAGWPHSVAASASSALISSELYSDLYPLINLGFLLQAKRLRLECFLSFIREVAFGAGADSMAATWLHSVVAAASLTLILS